LVPSSAVNELVQVLPPLIEYSTSAPASVPVTLSVPTLVMWSELELPLSVVSATAGAAANTPTYRLVASLIRSATAE